MNLKLALLVAAVLWSWSPAFFVRVADAGVDSASIVDKETQEEFYRLLDKIRTDSVMAQISALQSFVENHAEFELVYSKLLERYLLYDRSIEAKAYFQRLAAAPQYRRNSFWMLAKLFVLENNPTTAFAAFSQALRASPPSLSLLKDFIEFDHQQAGKFGGPVLLRESGLNRESQKIITAFYCYKKLEYEQALKIFLEVSPNLSHDPVVLHVWGECFYRLMRHAQADSIWHVGLAINRANGNRESEAQFLSDLGFLKYVARDYNPALSYFDSASAIASRTEDPFRMQWLAGHRAYIHRDRSEYTEAIKQFKEAIQIGVKIGAYRYCADWYRGYAFTLYYLENYNEALQAFDKSEECIRKGRHEERLVWIKLDKGTIYVTLKQHDLAKKVFQEAYELAQSKKLTYQQYYAKYKLGEILLLEKKYAQAREYYQEFITFLNKSNLSKDACEIMGRVAKTYMLEGRYEIAKDAYLQAYEVTKEAGLKAFEGWYLLRIADIEVILGNIEAAIQKYNLVRDIALKENNTAMLWELYLGYGNAYKKSGDLTAAIAAYRRAADIIETSMKDLKAEQLRIGYFIEGQQVYRNLAQCFLQRYEHNSLRADLDTLFYYEAMGRSRALQDLKLKEVPSSQSNEYVQAQQQLRSLQRRLRQEAEKSRSGEEWENLLSQLEAARYSLITQRLRLAGNDTLHEKTQRYRPGSLADILAELKRRESGLLLYHISEDLSFVLAAAGDQVKVVRLQVNPSAMASAADSLITPFHAIKEDSVQQTLFRAAIAHRLYQSLIQPVEQALPLPTKLVVVPDLTLMNLPFELLLMSPPNASVYSPTDFPDYANQFLTQRYAFVYNPSASLLQERSKAVARNSKVLVFANPFAGAPQLAAKANQLRSRTGWRFDPLPFSEIEAKRIQDAQPPTQVRKREAATKADFIREAPQHKVVHIASHAFVDTTFDAFSGLVLAASSDSTDDGILMGYEISDLNLGCDLVTLSACETGQGQRVAGEGVLGLPRLFLGAGVNTVLMTLWKVDDKFASELMPQFYENFLNQGLSKAEALCQAKRAMLRSKTSEKGIYYQHPFYWASFTLYGDPGLRRQPETHTVEFILVAAVIVGLIGFFFFRHFRLRKIILF